MSVCFLGTSSSDEVKILDELEVKTVETDKDKVTNHIENTGKILLLFMT